MRLVGYALLLIRRRAYPILQDRHAPCQLPRGPVLALRSSAGATGSVVLGDDSLAYLVIQAYFSEQDELAAWWPSVCMALFRVQQACELHHDAYGLTSLLR